MTNAESILDKEVHARLLQDIEHICEVANVPQKFVHQSMTSYCGDVEIDWVVNFNKYRAEGCGGLVLTGKGAEDRSMAICGALIRNFIDARIILLNTIISEAKEDLSSPTVMIVPNLYVSSHGKPLTAWQIQTAYDVLVGRLVANKPTVVFVESMKLLHDAYGSVFAEHLNSHFKHC